MALATQKLTLIHLTIGHEFAQNAQSGLFHLERHTALFFCLWVRHTALNHMPLDSFIPNNILIHTTFLQV